MKYLSLLLLPLLVACQENYRYPCQDPENWENKECKKPFCSANGTCPEDLRHYEKGNNNAPVNTVQPQTLNKGVCK